MSSPAIDPQQRHALAQASEWYVRLQDKYDLTAKAEWQFWHDASPTHGWAWSQVSRVCEQMGQLPVHASFHALNQSQDLKDRTRRQLLKMTLLTLGVGFAGWQGVRSQTGQALVAEYRTSAGQLSRFTLDDGSQLLLNTDSAVDVDFDAQRRLVTLHRGEISIRTAKDETIPARPFYVKTSDGSLRALGTYFQVRHTDGYTQLSVQEHAVEIVTQKTGMQAIVEAGQQRRFDAKTISAVKELPLAAASWEQALLSVSHWPLSQLIDELARYQSGYLSCASDAANLRVSGTFPLDNISHAITLIARVLPIKVRYVSRYWARVSLR